MLLISLFLVNCVLGRLLQRGPPPRGDHQGDRQNQNATLTFESFLDDVDQDQRESLDAIQGYLMTEGFLFYSQASEAQQQKMKAAFFGLFEELDKLDEQGDTRVEQNIEYFSKLNTTEQDKVLTLISQQLHKDLDGQGQFDGKAVLETIETQIEKFKQNPNINVQSTWNTKQYIQQEEEQEKYWEDLIIQIEEQIEKGLTEEQIKQNLTTYYNTYFGNSTQPILEEIIKETMQEEQKQNNTEQGLRAYRQQIRELIRLQIKDGKSEEEITAAVYKFLYEQGVTNLTVEDKERIQMQIRREITKYKRAQERLKEDNNEGVNTDTNTDTDIKTPTQSNADDNTYITYICVFGGILVVILVGFAIRRQIMKVRQNTGGKTGFSIPESHDIEQME